MSDRPILPETPPPAPVVPPEPFWAKPMVSFFALGIFVVAYLVAYLSHDNATLLLMAGATIGMANQVISYWVGGSSGSTAKSALLAEKK